MKKYFVLKDLRTNEYIEWGREWGVFRSKNIHDMRGFIDRDKINEFIDNFIFELNFDNIEYLAVIEVIKLTK